MLVPTVDPPVEGGRRRADNRLVVGPTGEHELDLGDPDPVGGRRRGVEDRSPLEVAPSEGTITAVVGGVLSTVIGDPVL